MVYNMVLPFDGEPPFASEHEREATRESYTRQPAAIADGCLCICAQVDDGVAAIPRTPVGACRSAPAAARGPAASRWNDRAVALLHLLNGDGSEAEVVLYGEAHLVLQQPASMATVQNETA